MNQTIYDINDSNVSRLLNQIKEITQDELYDEMSKLKNRVLGMLKDYSNSLHQKENARALNQKIRKDASQINEEYSVILDQVNQSVDCSFMSIESIPQYQKYEKDMNNMFNLVEEFLEKFNGKKPKRNLYSSFISDKMERSGISFADTSVIDVNHRINIIKDELAESLQDKKYSQIIVLETVDALGEALNSERIEKIRTIIKKIEKYMHECQHDSTDLYQMLQRALESCRDKQNELENSNVISDKDNKRKFFDLALQIKSELAVNHPGRRVLISMLYEKGQDLPQEEWQQWIQKQLNNN